MRLAWFTPLSTNSAIGRASAAIARELAASVHLDVFHSESGPTLPVQANTVCFRSATSLDPHQLAEYDLIFYNLGNHLPLHLEIFLASRRFPGVIVLHDYVLHHFFATYYFEHLRDPSLYDAEMARLYGPPGLAAALRRHRSLPVAESPDVIRFPFFEPALSGALGVVTHSDFLLRRVQSVFPGPACKIPLPYEPLTAAPLPRESLPVPQDALLLLTTGHVNPNKRIETVLMALAAHPDTAARWFYMVAGPSDPDYLRRLHLLTNSLGLTHRVRFLGYVDDQTLLSCLHHADICINLRFPPIEGASASIIEQMLHAKPIIVPNTGSFRELPHDTVRKVASSHDPHQLLTAIQSLTSHASRAALSARALAYASQTFRADAYARQLLTFCSQLRPPR